MNTSLIWKGLFSHVDKFFNIETMTNNSKHNFEGLEGSSWNLFLFEDLIIIIFDYVFNTDGTAVRWSSCSLK